jgi:hypothetical protein
MNTAGETGKTSALKGRKIIAQGKARRRPGFASHKIFPALKGRPNLGLDQVWRARQFCFALSGLNLILADEPRALPWAVILRPVGAGNGAPRAASAAGPTAPDGKGGWK